MVTDQDIEQAQAALAEAQQQLDKIAAVWLTLEPSQGGGAALKAAQGRVELAAARLDHLNQQHAAELAAIAARPGIEKANGNYIRAAAADLAAADERVSAAVNALQEALAGVVRAVDERNALLFQTVGELSAMGLTLDEGADYQTGAAPRRGATPPAVRVDGRWWAMAKPAEVLNWTNARFSRAWEGRAYTGTWHPMSRRRDGMLAGVEAPGVKPLPPLPLVRRGQVPETMAAWFDCDSGRYLLRLPDGSTVDKDDHERKLAEQRRREEARR